MAVVVAVQAVAWALVVAAVLAVLATWAFGGGSVGGVCSGGDIGSGDGGLSCRAARCGWVSQIRLHRDALAACIA